MFMKEGWEYKKLGAVADFYRGLTYKREDEVDSSDNCVLRSNNINLESMSLDFDELKYLRPDFVIPEDKKLKANSIFVCMSNGSKQHVGKVAYVNEDMNYAFGGFMGLIVPKPQARGRYIYYVCRSTLYRHFLEQIGNGIGITNLRFSDLNEFSIPFPSLSEQQHIVEELDLLSSIIEKKKAQLNELDNLAQSLFYEMFGDPITNEKGWDVKKIGEIGYVERGAGISKKDFVDDGLPCIHYGQLHTILGPTTYKNKTFIPSNLLSKYKIAHPGDVIMAITSEDVEGSCKSTAWLGNFDVVVGSDAAIFHHSINGVYISYYTMTKSFYNEKAKYANGFKVTHISTKEIESIPIPLPPLDLQDKFANSIKSIEHQKELIKQSIKEVETLFNSRMDYYFN